MDSDPPAIDAPSPCVRAVGWRAALRRELALLVALKIAALALLWGLFFSPAHRTPVDAATAGRRLAVERTAPPARTQAAARRAQP